MPFSNKPLGSSRVARARSTGLGQRRRAARPAPTDARVRLWRGIGYGLAITASAGAIIYLAGCTIERVVFYETVNYPAPAVTASGRIGPS